MASKFKHDLQIVTKIVTNIIRRCFHEVTVVKKNCIHFALRFSSLPSLRENKDELSYYMLVGSHAPVSESNSIVFLFVIFQTNLFD